MEWLSDPARIFRESAALSWLSPHLLRGSLPEVLFVDHDQFAYAMTSAPLQAQTWKSALLGGELDEAVARRAGEAQAEIIRASWQNASAEELFADQRFFRELRVDPYYRVTAERHPDLRNHFDNIIAETAARRLCLVHGDWSPKNFLVTPQESRRPDTSSLMVIDFEVIHFGDPAFDSAFLLNHLLLKSFHRPQWRAGYRRLAIVFFSTLTAGLPEPLTWFEAATVRHLGCLLLARIDGKSPAEYLTGEGVRQAVRERARWILENRLDRVEDAFSE